MVGRASHINAAMVGAMLAAEAASTIHIVGDDMDRNYTGYRKPPERCTGKIYGSNGKREIARRLRHYNEGRYYRAYGLGIDRKSALQDAVA